MELLKEESLSRGKRQRIKRKLASLNKQESDPDQKPSEKETAQDKIKKMLRRRDKKLE